uniref:Uncharacterized protein n=1 Tax=Anopheles coluzzii TaxID=1518534 RepID=A0A8W7Q0Q0_ANOCL
MVVCDKQIRHGEEGGIHNARSPAKHDHPDTVLRQGHQRHPQAVEEQPADVDTLSPEALDEPFDDQGVAGTGQRVHGHAPAAEPDARFVQQILFGTVECLQRMPYNSLADKIGKVERIADVRHPAEQVRQADHPQRVRHIDDRQQGVSRPFSSTLRLTLLPTLASPLAGDLDAGGPLKLVSVKFSPGILAVLMLERLNPLNTVEC